MFHCKINMFLKIHLELFVNQYLKSLCDQSGKQNVTFILN